LPVYAATITDTEFDRAPRNDILGSGAMGLLSWLILGLIAGFIGSKIVNKTGSGMIMDIVLGVVGAIVGGYIGNLIGVGGVTGLNIFSLVLAVIGAIVVLLVYRAVAARA
jgi:uncharacterized membrane protein YeaQ/YmgE (transglycosylase-associated protein family)